MIDKLDDHSLKQTYFQKPLLQRHQKKAKVFAGIKKMGMEHNSVLTVFKK